MEKPSSLDNNPKKFSWNRVWEMLGQEDGVQYIHEGHFLNMFPYLLVSESFWSEEEDAGSDLNDFLPPHLTIKPSSYIRSFWVNIPNN